jgi:hypothetical protein
LLMDPMRQPKVALQLPTWGGASVQLPVPKAPLFLPLTGAAR